MNNRLEELRRAALAIEGKAPVLIALDGRCAAGKTTLAETLHDRFGWSVVHMDDFFLRPEQRSAERYAAPGGNIDHERFLAEVLEPLSGGRFPAYRAFDCRRMALGQERRVEPAPVVLVEGSYACHPALWDRYDLRVFLTVDPAEQLRRIALRNGPQQAEVFRTRWIPLEERYFAAFQVERRCEIRLRAEELLPE